VLAAERYDKPNPVNIARVARSQSGISSNGSPSSPAFARDRLGCDPTRWAASAMHRRVTPEREFGFRATTDFVEGLRQTIEWYRAERKTTAEQLTERMTSHDSAGAGSKRDT